MISYLYRVKAKYYSACLFAVWLSFYGYSQNISTIAGNGSSGFNGDGGQATSATLNYPQDITLDSVGNVFIADWQNCCVRKITASTGIITTVAGWGLSCGSGGDGGQATSAGLSGPGAVCFDRAGNLYIADSNNNKIRKVTKATGIITTVAGKNGPGGYNGDGILATSASLYGAAGVCVDDSGNIYIADNSNHRIRKVTAATGIISTIAGNGTSGFSGDGGLATAAQFYYPSGVTMDTAGNFYIGDWANHRVRKVTASTGIITTVAGNGINGFAGDGGLATSASLTYVHAVGLDPAGNMYLADITNNRIRKVMASTGIITTVAGIGTQGFSGDGGSALSAELNRPYAARIDSLGNMYIVEQYNQRVRKVIGVYPGSPVIMGNTTICNGKSTTLTASGGTTYSWSTGESASTITVSPSATVVYTVTATTGTFVAATTTTVTVNPTPTVTAGGNASILCKGKTTVLNASGANTYVWSPAAGLSNPNISNPIAGPTTSTNYTVTGTNTYGCKDTSTYSITVNPTPTVSISGIKTICNGESTTLTASGASSYVWIPSGSLDNSSIANPVATPTTSTNYFVTGTDVNGCTGTSTYSVTVKTNPGIGVSGIKTICNGKSTTLSASGASSYVWSPSGSLSNSTIANPVADPTSSTTYTIIGTYLDGCTKTYTCNITVNPTPAVIISGNNTICSGSCVTLTASGASTYTWVPIGQTFPTLVRCPTSLTTYTVDGKDANGCTNTAASPVTVNPLPVLSVTSVNATAPGCCNGSDSVSASGGISPYTYNWSNGCTTSACIGLCTGSYSISVSDSVGCIKTSTFTISCLTGIELDISKIELASYPNPTHGLLHLSYPGTITDIIIMDMMGKKMIVPVSIRERTIDLSPVPAGIYLINLKTPNGIVAHKVLRE